MIAEKDIWVESGWYDCCSGYWFLQYDKKNNDGTIITMNNEDDILLYYFITKINGVGYETQEFFDMLDKIQDNYEEKDINLITEEIEAQLKNMFSVKYDESIDHNQNWTCRD